MIRPLYSPQHSPQLTSVKPRTGLQSIADLVPRLIRQYEIQAELRQRQQRNNLPSTREIANNHAPATPRQATFAWFE